jgi:sulfofructose kinase
MCKLLAFGGLTCDILSVIPEMPSWEVTSYIEEYQMQQGGMAATAIVAASRLGAGTEYIGGISNDLQGEFLKDNFRKYHVKSDRVRVFENEISPFTIVLIDKATGRKTFLHKKGVQERAELFKDDLDLTGVRYILFDGFYFDTALRTAEQARKRGIVSVTDISPRNRNPKLLQYLGLIDYPILSELFVKSYFQTEDVLEAGKKLYTKNNKALLVTCGDRGVYVITDEGSEHIPAFKVKPLDTTGAGDVFHGAFLFSLWKGYPLHEAVLFSSAVSALKCTKIGGQSGIPDFNETKRFLIRQLPSCAGWLK